MRRSEKIAARMAQVCLLRQIAFTAAACVRARSVFALCHGATSIARFDAATEALWEGIRNDDLPAIEAVFQLIADAPESNVDDTLDRNWIAWLALATLEFPSRLARTVLTTETLDQSSAFMLTVMNEMDLRLGWDGAPYSGALVEAEWTAQDRCVELLTPHPQSPDIPIKSLVAAGREVAEAIASRGDRLAAATGWHLSFDK